MSTRYLIFAGWDCYPSGGMCDYFGAAQTLEDAIKVCDDAIDVDMFDWAHVFDKDAGRIVHPECAAQDWEDR